MNSQNSTLYYTCPECEMEQVVYLVPEIIAEDNSYRFTTACSDCKTELMIKVDFSLDVTERVDGGE